MKKAILIALLRTRSKSAVRFQKVLTKHGCMVKTRLGIHDGVAGSCSDTGLIILELVGSGKDAAGLARKLNAIAGVSAKLVGISLKK
ncbi:MAG TPA: hypothetical protein PLV09_02375 [Candidatus Omnitrophota bacterium]|nr:hypothetical protein [Candidatus Omnitrophota bacterium]MDD5738179.1 hypothetical protein [Candidatus Omnitrophota bacterium]HOX09916.1 hypothetical protein [Candidatus Omnitrophota bacterium]HPN66245.1 hypothetical protein [Candidatus Omnitrophota bacterium]HRZ67434.1 hypothetical protein [Candidatus Omnitrophota bacterium]